MRALHGKKVISLCILTLTAVLFVMTGRAGAADGKIGGELVIYTTTDDANIARVIPPFEEKTGVKVSIISGSAGECLSRISAEKENPQGDVMWGGLTPSDYNKYPDLWTPYVSSHDGEYPKEYRCANGVFNNFMIQTINLLVNTELAEELGVEIKGYADLLNPVLKGKIIHADPTSSSSAWRHLSTQLLVMGGYESKASWDYLEAFIQNLNGVTTTSSSAVYRQVAEGEYVVGLTYENVCIELLQSGATNVKIVYMSEGTTASPFASAIVKNAKHLEQAKAFIEWLTSEECQRGYAERSSSRPANANLKSTNPNLVDYSAIKVVPEDQDYLAKHKSEIQQKWTELWAKYN
ncbi:MAG: extracellular solute-binding protein, partial [Synergistaceae bacterium]|jgi:iron(III) transport system substrate-binding protein|nr:extracellular solute-binding protein [Synergistaceae bacterium]